MNVAKIRFNDKDAPAAFTKSLKETGFGVITGHPIDLSLMERVYNEWKQFFSSDSKFEYLFDPQKQDGYFPLGTENAKGYNAKDHKEFFHLGKVHIVPYNFFFLGKVFYLQMYKDPL